MKCTGTSSTYATAKPGRGIDHDNDYVLDWWEVETDDSTGRASFDVHIDVTTSSHVAVLVEMDSIDDPFIGAYTLRVRSIWTE